MNYPDNVVKAFISAAAKNGIDIFRIFDCFNDLEQMRVSIEAVREAGKACPAVCCMCMPLLVRVGCLEGR